LSAPTRRSSALRLQPVFLSAASPSQTVLNLGYDFTSCNANSGNYAGVTTLTPVVTVAVAARSTAAATVARISIGATVFIAAYAASPYVATVGQSDADEMAAIAQHDKEEAEKQEAEPQADASGAGARKGGGKGPFEPTKDNINRMENRQAPVGTDGHPVELHHDGQQANSPVKEMTRTEPNQSYPV